MLDRRAFSLSGLTAIAAGLGACSSGSVTALRSTPPAERRSSRTLSRPNYAEVYAAYPGERFPIFAVDYGRIDPRYLRQTVEFPWREPPGSIVVDPGSYHLYFVESLGVATRYGVGVGREGFGWAGAARINMKRDWPDWVPPREMVERQPEIRAQLEQTPRGLGVRGGPKSPLGARAMYLFGEGRDLGYRIHGTLEPETVGSNVSSGCVRMINQDIAHLYARVALGTPVTVLAA
ncbi:MULTISPECIES: L,D-transpeptidase [unclassified Bosea (in: a-proteobacteria)]|uniref:L,D-transpeptidase n=1 Tax=unclassified Bosea (in: a-proteobacteria) TaxID=2653178 RepID=UPI000955A6EF|nr:MULTISPECIES: L,D-transpeptidase [unclassified Bosea (in: a-proteobacteria)]TAJ30640.1 MAG: L,D-transpeptidase [Bosea sp. (in: a-proteobacteria)]SIQ86413.1 Lipoprotein-anchoring transpeptidase ErfK/SrfK [Bosea sp. TND4EK4]